MAWRVGIDVGGTFTDLCLLDNESGAVLLHKLPSTPGTPEDAPIQGILRALERARLTPRDLAFVGLGTTVATNALLERKGAKTALITTRGFRDLLEIGRQKRPDVYDVYTRKPAPLVPRDRRLEAPERIGADGSVVTPVDPDGVVASLGELLASGTESVAICFLHAYANPRHERVVAEAVRTAWPELCVSVSHEVLAEFREYERLTSTVVNAYLMPGTKRYFARFAERVEALGVSAQPLIVTSAGGVVGPRVAGARPVDLLLSGPSGGVNGATYVAGLCGERNLITLDMGGTSTDVSLVRDGRPQLTVERAVGGIPMKVMAVDVHTVGAGGGSIAWVDGGGFLRVGPSSAGAHPGPACYGLGGTAPTVTDANLVLGRLPQHLLGGALRLHPSLAADAIKAAVAAKKDITPAEAAAAILAVCTANAAQAVRVVSVEQGYDPQEFTLVAFGGAGPLHAAAVARELGVHGILIPRYPGVLSAFGVLAGDIAMNFSQTKLIAEDAPSAADKIDGMFSALEARARVAFQAMRVDAGLVQLSCAADMRYTGQNHELTVDLYGSRFDEPGMAAAREAYHVAHERLYGFRVTDRPIEFVTYRLRARVPVKPPVPAEQADAAPVQTAVPASRRPVFFTEAEAFVDCPVYAREALVPGAHFEGPGIVEQLDTTTVVPPGFSCRVDGFHNLRLLMS